jgi:pimeloyl-ACP methyl ester carboxylesterase
MSYHPSTIRVPRILSLALVLVLAPTHGDAADVFGLVRDHYADSGGVRIHYVTRGRGTLVVFLHGFPDFWYGWRDQIEALSKHYQVAALDLRGYNLSDKPTGVDQYGFGYLTADVAAVIHDLGRTQATIVGHDWGGAIAWMFAILHPEMSERLIVLQTPHPRGLLRELRTNPSQQAASAYARAFQQDNAAQGFTPEVLATIATTATTDAGVRARYLEAFQRSDIEAMLDYYKANYPREPYADVPLPNVKVPVLILDGTADPFLLSAGHNSTWDWVDAPVTLVAVPGIGHFIQRDASALVTQSIKRWLRDRRSDAHASVGHPRAG